MTLARRLALPLLLWSLMANGVVAAAEPYTVGVLPQRSAVLTAGYWNPILRHVSRKAGVKLALVVARTGGESRAAAAQGAYDFVYSNHIFQPAVATSGYRVILRPRALPIRGELVCLDGAPLAELRDLEGKTVGFPSQAAFAGYALPMDQLVRRGIQVNAVFGGNQEGIMAQLRAGKVAAAAVNSQLMADYAEREGFRYRVLWSSGPFHNLPVAVHPRVPEAVARAVQKAFAEMDGEPEGLQILAASAALIGQRPPLGFQPASAADYRSDVEFYRSTVLTGLE